MDTITITAQVRQELAPGVEQWIEHTVEDLPSWGSGDPAMTLALYLFGYRDAVDQIRYATVL